MIDSLNKGESITLPPSGFIKDVKCTSTRSEPDCSHYLGLANYNESVLGLVIRRESKTDGSYREYLLGKKLGLKQDVINDAALIYKSTSDLVTPRVVLHTGSEISYGATKKDNIYYYTQ